MCTCKQNKRCVFSEPGMRIFSLLSDFRLFGCLNLCYFIYFQSILGHFLSISDFFLKMHSHACKRFQMKLKTFDKTSIKGLKFSSLFFPDAKIHTTAWRNLQDGSSTTEKHKSEVMLSQMLHLILCCFMQQRHSTVRAWRSKFHIKL